MCRFGDFLSARVSATLVSVWWWRFFGRILIGSLIIGPAAADEFPYSEKSLGILPGKRDSVSAVERHPPHLYAPQDYQLGRPATAADIAAWDIDIRYDGTGLPPGEGSVATGEALYDAQCALCHGDFGQGEGRWPVLVGGFDSLKHQGGSQRPEKTVGSYWPYAATLFDYIRRTMPYTAPQSLSDNETYALVAYLLNLNNLADDDFIADADTLANFAMPNRDSFFPDPRPDITAAACMTNCLVAADIALVETIKGLTPEQQLQSSVADTTTTTAETDTNSNTAKTAATATDSNSDISDTAIPDGKTAATATAPPPNYTQFCAVCHDTGLADAPKPGDSEAWQKRLATAGSTEALIRSAISGIGTMPPKGGATHLTDDQIAELVLYLTGRK